MMLAGGVIVLSLLSGNVVDAEVPAAPPATARHAVPEAAHLYPPAAEPAPPRRWYGWQLMLADAASLTLGLAGKTGAPAIGATLGFTLAAPALHFAHGDSIIGGISLFVRASVLGIAAADDLSWNANQQSTCHDDSCKKTLDDVLPGLIAIGAGLAFVIVDDTYLSREAAPVHPGRAQARQAGSSFAFAPTLAPTSGGLSMGLVGTF